MHNKHSQKGRDNSRHIDVGTVRVVHLSCAASGVQHNMNSIGVAGMQLHLFCDVCLLVYQVELCRILLGSSFSSGEGSSHLCLHDMHSSRIMTITMRSTTVRTHAVLGLLI